MAMERADQLAPGWIKQSNLTTPSRRSHQSAIGRSRQKIRKISPGNMPRCPVRVGQIVELDFMVVAPWNGHHRHPPARGKGSSTEPLVDGCHDVPGFDLPDPQGI